MSARACNDCGSMMALLETSHGGATTFRKMQCECGARYESEERIARRLPPAPARARRQAPAAVEAPPPTPADARPPSSGGGFGGGLPEGSNSRSDSGPISPADPDRARAKSKRGADDDPFEPEFVAEWDQTAKTGSKRKARRAWRKAGKPQFGASWKRWEACPEWRQDWFNHPHVATWINDGRYAQDPAEAQGKVSTPRLVTPLETFQQRREREQRQAREEREEDEIFGGVG